MIPISEARLLVVITDTVVEKMPGILLELEEALDYSISLPTFRYAGSAKAMPPGPGMPYVLFEIRSSETEIKDRIIRNEVFSLMITLGLSETELYPLYSAGMQECLKSLALQNIHIRMIRKMYPDTMEVVIVV